MENYIPTGGTQERYDSENYFRTCADSARWSITNITGTRIPEVEITDPASRCRLLLLMNGIKEFPSIGSHTIQSHERAPITHSIVNAPACTVDADFFLPSYSSIL